MTDYKIGLKAGIPIGLGYLSVAFTFGIMAISIGLNWWAEGMIYTLYILGNNRNNNCGKIP